MSLSDFVASRLSRPAGRVLDAPIRDAVHAILRESGYASPAEMQSLRDDVRDLRSRLDTLDRRLGDLVKMVESARAEAQEAKAEAARAREAGKAVAPKVPEAPAAARAPAPAPTPAAQTTCKVKGCDEPVRSKGFCSAHYQQWRRGTLRGFVGLDGTAVVDGGKAVRVASHLAGAPVTERDGRVYVEGKAV